MVVCLLALCVCKGAEVGGLLLSHSGGSYMGFSTFLRRAREKEGFARFQASIARPDLLTSSSPAQTAGAVAKPTKRAPIRARGQSGGIIYPLGHETPMILTLLVSVFVEYEKPPFL